MNTYIITFQVYPNTNVESVSVEADGFELTPEGLIFYVGFGRDSVAAFKTYITVSKQIPQSSLEYGETPVKE